MSSGTYVRARFEPDVATAALVEGLEKAFAIIGATRVEAPLRVGSDSTGPLRLGGSRRVGKHVVVDRVCLFFAIPGEPPRVYRADAYSFEPDSAGNVDVIGETMGFGTEYDETSLDLALRFFRLAEEIHVNLNAAETVIEVAYHDDLWYALDRNTPPTPPPPLELEPCQGSHMMQWIEDPLRPVRDLDVDTADGSDDSPFDTRSAAPEFPVSFDPEFREFTLELKRPGVPSVHALLRCCLGCGGALEASERDALFECESDSSARALREVAWRARDLDDVVNRLGPPDLELPGFDFEESGRVDDDDPRPGVRRQLAYGAISPDSVVIFRPMMHGLILVQHAGKWKGRSRAT